MRIPAIQPPRPLLLLPLPGGLRIWAEPYCSLEIRSVANEYLCGW
jgi:hypothetical protein